MITLQDIQTVSQTATSYADLAKKYADIGIQSYTVDVSTDVICYRLAEGELLINYSEHQPKVIAPAFNKTKVIQAIEASVAKRITYPEFMQLIAQAGVFFYEATLIGNNRRVTYIGISDSHIEQIPSV